MQSEIMEYVEKPIGASISSIEKLASKRIKQKE